MTSKQTPRPQARSGVIQQRALHGRRGSFHALAVVELTIASMETSAFRLRSIRRQSTTWPPFPQVIPLPRQGQWRLAAAYARGDRLTFGVLGAPIEPAMTIRRDGGPDHALLHPQE
jgi:hypothetical protein